MLDFIKYQCYISRVLHGPKSHEPACFLLKPSSPSKWNECTLWAVCLVFSGKLDSCRNVKARNNCSGRIMMSLLVIMSLLIMIYFYLLLMYKLKGFILSVTVVSLLDFNNTGLGGPAHWTLSPGRFLYQNSGPAHAGGLYPTLASLEGRTLW